MKKINYKKRKLINYVKIKCRELPMVILNKNIKQLFLKELSQVVVK